MAVGDIELTNEGFVNRGLGTSPVASRRIQQLNIDELKNLRSSVAESVATQRNVQKEQSQKLLAEVLKKGVPALRAPVVDKPQTIDPSKPLAVLVAGQPTTGSPERFGITFKEGGSGQVQTLRFANTLDAIDKIKELQQKGVQVILPGTPAIQNEELKQFLSRGVIQTSDQAALQAFYGKSQRTSALGTTLGATGFTPQEQAQRAVDKQIAIQRELAVKSIRETGSPVEALRINNTQEISLSAAERSRVVDYGLSKVLSSDYADENVRNLVMLAYRKGQGYNFISDAIKKGAL